MTDRRDVLSGSILLAIAVAYSAGTRGLPAGQGEPGPAFFPMLLAGALAVLGALILAGGLARRGPAPEPSERGVADRTPWKPPVLAGLTALYVASFQPLGFAASTWLFTLAITLLVRGPGIRGVLLIPAISTMVIYLLFRVVLAVPLPVGVLG